MIDNGSSLGKAGKWGTKDDRERAEAGCSHPFAQRAPAMARGRAVRARLAAGFSLLEIVIVLGLAAVLVGGAITVMVVSSSERILRNTAGDIEVLAKRARAVALLQQTPYALEFTEGRVRMLPLAEVGLEGEDLIAAQAESAAAEEQAGIPPEMRRRTPVRAELQVEGGMLLEIRRWGTADFLPLEGERAIQVWRFDPNGLCEPVTVRLVVGSDWIEEEYHPLTASVRDTAMSAK
jgi:type II secretory pathway pseudopilin PulG